MVSKANRKYYRTIFLGVAAMGTLVWAAVDQFGIPWRDMLALLLQSLLMLAAVIAAAAVCVALVVCLRRLLGSRHED